MSQMDAKECNAAGGKRDCRFVNRRDLRLLLLNFGEEGSPVVSDKFESDEEDVEGKGETGGEPLSKSKLKNAGEEGRGRNSISG